MDEKYKLYNVKIIYSMKLRDSLKSVKFDTEFYKKVRNVVFLTIIIGGFFAWCSASEPTKESTGSNIYVFLDKYLPNVPYSIVFFCMILLLLFICIFAFIPTVKSIGDNIQIQKFESEIYQKKLFIRYIYSKIPTLADKPNYTMDDLKKIFVSEEQDIVFNYKDFEDFCLKYFQKCNQKLPDTFIDDLSKITLINECMDENLICEKDGFTYKFTFIINKNIEIFREPVNEL